MFSRGWRKEVNVLFCQVFSCTLHCNTSCFSNLIKLDTIQKIGTFLHISTIRSICIHASMIINYSDNIDLGIAYATHFLILFLTQNRMVGKQVYLQTKDIFRAICVKPKIYVFFLFV